MPPKRDSKTGRYTAVFGQPSPLGHGTYPKHNQPVFGQPSTLNHNNNVFGVGASVKAKTSTSGFETLAHTSGGPVFKPPPSDFVGGVHKKRKAIFLLKNCKRNFK